MPTLYKIIEIRSGFQVGGIHTNLRRARNRANKLDLQYGAINYRVELVS